MAGMTAIEDTSKINKNRITEQGRSPPTEDETEE
jgi:hypothetical protein